MAAHEERISQNRRRLFKALSTAPVVATLSPGSALANNSALQCLVNNPQPTPLQDAVPFPDCEPNSCYVYEPISCWDLTNGRQNMTTVDPADWPSVELRELILESNLEICESPSIAGKFLMTDGTVFALSDAVLEKSADGSKLIARSLDGEELGGQTPGVYFEVPTTPKLGLVLVRPLNDQGAGVPAETLTATEIEIAGIVPDVQPGPILQGIQATCLTSAIPGSAATTIARG